MSLFDTHCHLDFPAFDDSRDQVIQRSVALGVTHFIIPGTEATKWRDQAALFGSRRNCFLAFGLHPYFIEKHSNSDLDELINRLSRYGESVRAGDLADADNHRKCIAVGEIGLDRTVPCWERQLHIFQEQVRIAKQFRLPVIVHSRKSHSDVIGILRRMNFDSGGVIHAFSGSYQDACQFINCGLSVGVGGVITYPRARKTRQAIQRLPLECLVLETDSPDMPLQGEQGKCNTPEQLPRILQVLSELRQESIGVLESALYDNAFRTFRLVKPPSGVVEPFS
ncbi:TatD-related deoxyribonuclease [Oleiphilus messinensis]|uniref:TatD-related deoxyribonuclease n=1 Tax=Oleiphilus messinensis TaxID=141451 RepID=A0A1Y0IH35_9GAMM|nr:TatD family hydrolase [Oleiphilus messinensis]ARU58713.1 TatD-related deoxyribonuclease [Oleiphilus messinensis]